MTTHRIAAEATLAWDAGNRRRRASAGLERSIDGVMATGGMLVVNAIGGLNLGLPEGRAGLSLGGALLAAGLAHMTHRRQRRSTGTRRAVPSYAPAYAPAYATAARPRPIRVRHHAA